MISREILELTRRDAEVLAAIKTQLIRIEGKLDSAGNKVDGLVKEIRCLDKAIHESLRDLPRLIHDAGRTAVSSSKRSGHLRST